MEDCDAVCSDEKVDTSLVLAAVTAALLSLISGTQLWCKPPM